MDHFLLPPGIDIVERGWLSANTILHFGNDDVSVVDTGYCAHQVLTLGLVENSLSKWQVSRLNKVINTHLHSDHCGGNAALEKVYQAEIHIPLAEAEAVKDWNEDLLSFRALGQVCPRFTYTHLLQPGNEITLGRYNWQILAAPGHDPHSIMLYQADHRLLISADALWEDGFGVIFPELWGESGFEETAQTLDLIEDLEIALVIPGHGKPFTDVAGALVRARSRLDYLASDSDRNTRHGMKVLLKYKLLEWRSIELEKVYDWIFSTPAIAQAAKRLNMPSNEVPQWLIQALLKSKAAKLEGTRLVNVD
jgi:glyoxylase-like metal-dependent hydrolase (beta-lactamase superfamily II)